MSARPARSIRQQLSRLTLGAVLLALLATVAAVALFEVTTFRPRALANAKAQADLIAQIIVPSLEFDDGRTATKLLEVLRNDPTVQSAAVYSADGSQLARYLRDPHGALPPVAAPARADGIEGNRLHASVKVSSEGAVIGRVWLEAAMPGWGGRVRRYGWLLLLVTGAVLTLSLTLAASIRRQITDPVQELADTARQVARDRNLELRAPARGHDEIGALARSFNEMLDALKARDRMLQEAEVRLTRQNAGLAEIARMDNAAGEPLEKLLAPMAALIARVLLVERVSVWLYNGSRDALHCENLFDRRTGTHTAGQQLARPDFPIYLASLDENRVIDVTDVAADARTVEFAGAAAGPAPATAMLDVPIRWRGEIAGVICNEHVGGARPWHPDEIAFAAASADHIALLLEQRESRRAGSDLRESEDRFRTFISQARDAIFTLTIDGRIESVNEAARTITGWDMDTWLGHRFQRVLLPEDVALAEKNFAAVIAGGLPPVFELRIRTRSGGLVTFEFSVSPRVRNGEVVGLLGIGRDVTERRQAAEARERLEHQLRQDQKMKAIGNLAGGIAHDFNNILTALIGNARLAELDLPADDPAREYIIQVQIASHRAKELVNQILVFSRRQEQKRLPLNLSEVVKESLKLLRPVLPSSIEIQTALQENAPLVNADATQLQQIIINLATNASHAMEEHGGRLEIGVRFEQLDAAHVREKPQLRAGRFLCLTIRDTGIGMNEETLQRIFEPFFTTKEPGKGTGLGLAMVHGIVEQHDGAIDVHSKPGKGTTFSIYFPVIGTGGSSSPLPAAAAAAPARGNGEMVMVVDDEKMVLSVARAVLLRANYRVQTFLSPLEAQEAFQATPDNYQLVITDLTMPRLKGTVLAAGLRQIRSNVPVILTTGFDGGLDVEALRTSGLRGPLQKPFSAESLLAMVSEAMRPGG